MEKEGIIGRIKVLMSEGADNANSFSKKVGIGPKDPKDMRKASPHPIDSKMSSYYNRHSWATFASEIGISLETIGRALGHSVWEKTVTSIYVKYDNKKIDEANRKVIDYLNG